MAKAHKLSFNASHTKHNTPFEPLYMDLYTSPLLSFNNEKYIFLSIIDDHSRFV